LADFPDFATFAGFSALAGLAGFAADLADAVLDAGALAVTVFAAGLAGLDAAALAVTVFAAGLAGLDAAALAVTGFALVAGLPLTKVGLARFATGLAEAFELVDLPPAVFAALAAFTATGLTDTDLPAAGFFADEPTGLAVVDFATDALALALAAADAFVAEVDLATLFTGFD